MTLGLTVANGCPKGMIKACIRGYRPVFIVTHTTLHTHMLLQYECQTYVNHLIINLVKSDVSSQISKYFDDLR